MTFQMRSHAERFSGKTPKEETQEKIDQHLEKLRAREAASKGQSERKVLRPDPQK